jgi:hypothetical protein
MQNARRHGLEPGGTGAWVDPFSSARYFDGWREPPPIDPPDPAELPPVATPRTWLLGTGWRRRGLIGIGEVPPARRRSSVTSGPGCAYTGVRPPAKEIPDGQTHVPGSARDRGAGGSGDRVRGDRRGR